MWTWNQSQWDQNRSGGSWKAHDGEWWDGNDYYYRKYGGKGGNDEYGNGGSWCSGGSGNDCSWNVGHGPKDWYDSSWNASSGGTAADTTEAGHGNDNDGVDREVVRRRVSFLDEQVQGQERSDITMEQVQVDSDASMEEVSDAPMEDNTEHKNWPQKHRSGGYNWGDRSGFGSSSAGASSSAATWHGNPQASANSTASQRLSTAKVPVQLPRPPHTKAEQPPATPPTTIPGSPPTVFDFQYFRDYTCTNTWRQHYAAWKYFQEWCVGENLPVYAFDNHTPATMPQIVYSYGQSWTWGKDKWYNWHWQEMVAQLNENSQWYLVLGTGRSGGFVRCTFEEIDQYDLKAHVKELKKWRKAKETGSQQPQPQLRPMRVWSFVLHYHDGTKCALQPHVDNTSVTCSVWQNCADYKEPFSGTSALAGEQWAFFKLDKTLRFDPDKYMVPRGPPIRVIDAVTQGNW